MTINTITVSEVLDLYKLAWNETKKKFWILLAVAILSVIPQWVVGMIPGAGQFLSGFISTFFSAGMFIVLHHWKKTGEVEIDKLFNAFTERELFKKLTSSCFFFGVLTIISGALFKAVDVKILPIQIAVWAALIVYSIFYTFFEFLIPLVLYKSVKLQEVFTVIFQIMKKNFWAVLMASLIPILAPLIFITAMFTFLGVSQGMTSPTTDTLYAFLIVFLITIGVFFIAYVILLPTLMYMPYLLYERIIGFDKESNASEMG